jgi:hypothetical protein
MARTRSTSGSSRTGSRRADGSGMDRGRSCGWPTSELAGSSPCWSTPRPSPRVRPACIQRPIPWRQLCTSASPRMGTPRTNSSGDPERRRGARAHPTFLGSHCGWRAQVASSGRAEPRRKIRSFGDRRRGFAPSDRGEPSSRWRPAFGALAPLSVAARLVPPRGFEPLISTLKGWRPRPLDDGGRERRRVYQRGTGGLARSSTASGPGSPG